MHPWLRKEIKSPSWLTDIAALCGTKTRALFRLPLPMPTSLLLGSVIGGASPLLLPTAARILPNYGPPWHSLAILGLIVLLQYFLCDRRQFQWGARSLIFSTIALVLIGVCVCASYYCCSYEHICLGGHMLHPPYSTSCYLNDATWVGGLVLAVATLVRARSPLALAAVVMSAFLISLRLVFGSFGGSFHPL